MKSTIPMVTAAKARESRFDGGWIARRVVATIAAGAALFGILMQRPLLSVAWRSAVVLGIGLCVIQVAERVTTRARGSTLRGERGGTR